MFKASETKLSDRGNLVSYSLKGLKVYPVRNDKKSKKEGEGCDGIQIRNLD